MASLIELVGTGKSRRARSHNSNSLSCSVENFFRFDPSFCKRMLNNRAFNVLDGNGRFNDTEHTGAFAWSRTNPASKFRKIVGFYQAIVCLVPKPVVNIIVPLWNKIVDRASTRHTTQHKPGMAVRCPAIHTTGTLLLQFPGSHLQMKFLPVVYSLQRLPVSWQYSLVLHETLNFSHINDLIFSGINSLKLGTGREYFCEMLP